MKAVVGSIEPGHVFIPFHYGYWDNPREHDRAANELTLTGWDPVSKQPYFKFAAVAIRKSGSRSLLQTASHAAGKALEGITGLADKVAGAVQRSAPMSPLTSDYSRQGRSSSPRRARRWPVAISKNRTFRPVSPS